MGVLREYKVVVGDYGRRDWMGNLWRRGGELE